MDEDGLITEVPPYLRAQSAPPPTGAGVWGGGSGDGFDPQGSEPTVDGRSFAPQPMVLTPRGQNHPEERTRIRPNTPTSALRQPTGATVLAARCRAGHFSPAEAPACRTCGSPVAPQEPIRIPRPTLGVLHLADGQRVVLDRGAVIGRRPAPVAGGEPWPHLVELPVELTHLSRNHVAVALEGWTVLVRDLGSSAGTTLHGHDGPPVRLRAHDPRVLEPGQMLMLADEFAVTFAVATT